MYYQQTIKKPITCSGIGIHSGRRVGLSLHPLDIDSGVIFRRRDLGVDIPANVSHVTEVNWATTLGLGTAEVATVEHLMSALYGMGIDNVLIEMDAKEVPIMDGSSAPFVFLLMEAGFEKQNKPKRVLKVKKPVEVRQGDKMARLEPSDSFRVSYKIDFPHPQIGRLERDITVSPREYAEQIAPARTFGFLRDVEALRSAGLALGGSLNNAVVLGSRDILNDHLRFPDEFVRHKILDCIGDMSLCGHPMLGHLIADKGGHAMHLQLVKALLDDREAWSLELAEEDLDLDRRMGNPAFLPTLSSP